MGEPGLTIPGEDDKIRNKYGNCTILLYEYLFWILGFVFPLMILNWVFSTT